MSLFKKHLGNTRIPHHKNTAGTPVLKVAPPAEVLLPMAQHIGAPATVVVKLGDKVKIGQLIGEATGFVSSPVYATVSGTVMKPETYMRPDGRVVDAVRIQNDGLMEVSEEVVPPVIESLDDLIEAVRKSGLVGLGGAGFPTSVKLDALKKGIVDTVVINGAECEPYITADTATMIDDMDYIVKAIRLIQKFTKDIRFVFGVEKNKPECIDALKSAFADDGSVSVVKLPTFYPQGAEKVLIYNTVGRVVPEGKLPHDAGCMIVNVSTLAYIAKYAETGMPLVERLVTVDGSAVKAPANVLAPIGTPISALAEAAGGFTEDLGKVLYGGPMMGVPVCSVDEPITKTTNAIIALNERDGSVPEATACIHCGRCVSACPFALNPTVFSAALGLATTEERVAKLEDAKINLCMECGCCSYVCPAKRPLVQNNRLAKGEVRTYRAHLAELERAKKEEAEGGKA